MSQIGNYLVELTHHSESLYYVCSLLSVYSFDMDYLLPGSATRGEFLCSARPRACPAI